MRVLGSRSGSHSGRLEAYSTGTGESFVPSRPFVAGERVTVHALVSAGSGAPAHAASTMFTIAHQASVSQKEFPINPGDPHAIQHYVSAPALTPSTVTHHHSRRARLKRREPRRPVPRALPGRGHGRADDRRTGRLAGVVSSAAGRRGRRPTSRSSPTKASRCSPGGRGASSKSASARAKTSSTTPPISPSPDPGGQRLSRRPARDPPDTAGHRLDRRVRPDPPEPPARARLQRRHRQRLGGPGDRHQDGPRDVGVARARARRAERIAQPRARRRQQSVGLRARQLGRSRTLRRRRAAVLAQHLDAV